MCQQSKGRNVCVSRGPVAEGTVVSFADGLEELLFQSFVSGKKFFPYTETFVMLHVCGIDDMSCGTLRDNQDGSRIYQWHKGDGGMEIIDGWCYSECQ